jgi:hypothetical protein
MTFGALRLWCLWLVFGVWLTGCAALADPPEEAHPARPSNRAAQEDTRIQSVVLPVFNASGRALRLASDLQLGLFEPFLSPAHPAQFSVPELIQAGFILGLEKAGWHPAAMGWTNERVPDSPESIEAAWRLVSEQQLGEKVVWITLKEWDDRVWRQRSIIRVTAEVIVFEPGRAESMQITNFQRHPFTIPPFSTLAQAAGHIGIRMASLAFQ